MASPGQTKKKFNSQTARNRAAWFDERSNVAPGMEWGKVDDLSLRSALAAALSAGATVSFSSAAGGAGIMYKVYHGDEQAMEFCNKASELNELLDMTLNNFAGDPLAVRNSCKRKTTGEQGPT